MNFWKLPCQSDKTFHFIFHHKTKNFSMKPKVNRPSSKMSKKNYNRVQFTTAFHYLRSWLKEIVLLNSLQWAWTRHVKSLAVQCIFTMPACTLGKLSCSKKCFVTLTSCVQGHSASAVTNASMKQHYRVNQEKDAALWDRHLGRLVPNRSTEHPGEYERQMVIINAQLLNIEREVQCQCSALKVWGFILSCSAIRCFNRYSKDLNMPKEILNIHFWDYQNAFFGIFWYQSLSDKQAQLLS